MKGYLVKLGTSQRHKFKSLTLGLPVKLATRKQTMDVELGCTILTRNRNDVVQDTLRKTARAAKIALVEASDVKIIGNHAA